MTVFQRDNTYDNSFAELSVYGNALALLKRQPAGSGQALHLDIGCGFGRIAEPLVEALGRTYVGCDLDDLGLASLAGRGFETHRLALSTEELIYQSLSTLIAGRSVASITIIDTLEHIHDPIGTIKALRRIALEHDAVIVISVPNTAHRDLGHRLMFGLWDYTEAGILDHTHRFLFSDSVLRRLLAHSGLRIVDSFDFLLSTSDQAFPSEHPVFQWGTQLFQFMDALRKSTDSLGNANQLVRLCVPSEPQAIDPFVGRGDVERPFLSILMRTQGNRIDSLIEALTCLAGQSIPDFEVLLLGHKLDAERTAVVQCVVSDQPAWMRDKIRFMPVDHGGRTAPLNVGYEAAQGQYIVTLDDDDTVFGHWIETFKNLAAAAPGRVLRSVAVTQSISRTDCRGTAGLRAESMMDRPYPAEFDWFDTLRVNRSPTMTLAFPRGVFHHLGIKLDEDLSTTEDWDYLLRAGALVGVQHAPEITAVYRFWTDAPSSKTEHSQSEWIENYRRITDRMDRLPSVLWPIGTTERVRDMMNHISALTNHTNINSKVDEVAVLASRQSPTFEADRLGALREVVNIYSSTSWKLTGPLRMLARLAGKPVPDLDDIWWLSAYDLNNLAASLRALPSS